MSRSGGGATGYARTVLKRWPEAESRLPVAVLVAAVVVLSLDTERMGDTHE